MADARKGSSNTVKIKRPAWQRPGCCAGVALCIVGAVAYISSERGTASGGQRGDRIDFSSLATVVSIDDYSPVQVQGLSAGIKDDKITLEQTSAEVQTSAEQPIAQTTAKLPELVARHAEKLQRHLEQGLRLDSAGENARAGLSKSQALQTDAAQIANVGASLGGGLKGSISGGRTGGRQGALSGVLH
jgi:hypothetical protein